MNGILVTAEDQEAPVGSREEIADPRQIDQDKKQDKRERQHNANLKYSVETAKLQLNYDIFVSLVLGVGGKHDPVDGNCPQVILTVFPELKGEGANAKEAQQDLVALAVFVMDTFQVLADGTVLPYPCMTGHGCRVHRLLLLRDTTAFGHHVMLLPWKVTQDELEQTIQQAMQPVTDLNRGRVGCEEVTQEQAVKTPAMDN
jgi:hypothetical protein